MNGGTRRVRRWGAAATAAMLAGAACTFGVGEAPPMRLTGFGDEERLEAELLASRSRCVACHAFEHRERIEAEPAPDLNGIGARKTPEGLRRWLADPHGSRPGTAMPDVMHGLRPEERAETIEALVHYLASQGGPLAPQPQGVDVRELERGRRLFHSVGCVACHEPQESIDELESATWEFAADEALAPSIAAELGAPAFDTSLDALARFLVDPLAARPSGRMPSLNLTDREARAIATYLLRDRCDAEQFAWAPGWEVETFEFDAAPPDFAELPPTRIEVVPSLLEVKPPRDALYGYRIRGIVEVPANGPVDFVVRADDGVRLYVDDELRIDEWHDQSPTDYTTKLHLDAGRHAVELHYFQNQGGAELYLLWGLEPGLQTPIPPESVSHAGLRFEPEPSTFELDGALAQRGRTEFARLGCGACHAIEGREPSPPPLRAPSFARAAASPDEGCLSSTPGSNAPRFDFDDRQRLALRTLLFDARKLESSRTPEEELRVEMKRLECYACHRRDDLGGPCVERSPYFQPSREVDLGDEGRFPPALDGVGAKLNRKALEELLHTGLGVRPYLATRMPVFGAANIARLGELFERVDGNEHDSLAPSFDARQVELGRRLAGSKGLGCIQCHSFNGVESLGIPAVDLGVVTARIQPAWFQRLLADPRSVGLNSRMPILWQTDERGRFTSPVKDILDGDPARQIDALWSYLSLREAMPLPEGLDTPDAAYELAPSDGPVMCAVFLGDSSPRGMMVGFPEGVHYAFDVEQSRLAWAWRGRFFNARGTWRARAGGLERPPVADASRFSDGLPFAFVAPDDPNWPFDPRAAGYRRLGWKLDAERRPVWRYALGEIEIEEHIAPSVERGRVGLLRVFVLSSPAPVDGLYFDVVERRPVREWKREGERFVARFEAEVEL